MFVSKSFVAYFSKIWDESNTNFPGFNRRYSEEEQNIRENRFEKIQEQLKKMQSKKNRHAIETGDPGQTFFPVFRDFMESVFDFHPEQLEIILSSQFKNVSRDFFYQARKFDTGLSPENIYQALRNVWIMNGLQSIMNLPVEITPSVFAYSLMYPYSDNLLDNSDVSDKLKKEFNKRFNGRLHGEQLSPESYTEKQLFRLVSLIESQFPRDEYPDLYCSLYAIQQGQTNSLKLINADIKSEALIREICFEKGGASVLADGFLVAGRLTEEQARALFGYGIYLQLLDDIQDAEEDAKANTKTLFSCRGSHYNSDEYINRTINFGRRALNELVCFNGAGIGPMLQLMDHSIASMLIESVGLNPAGYSIEWLQKLESHSPLHFNFIRDKKSKSGSQRFTILKKYFEQAPKDFIPLKNNIMNQILEE